MGSKHLDTTLGELLSSNDGFVQTGPFGSQLHASDYVERGIPCIMPANISGNRICLDDIAQISKKDAFRLSKHIVEVGDIVYSRRGDVTRKALIRETDAGMFCGTGCLLIRPGESVDPQFLFYHLSTPQNQEWIIRHAIGATMPNLNTGILSAIPLQIPELNTQKAIAHILGSLDDRIELNRRMNETLESMAQALFKSWFVDFDPVIDNALANGKEIPDALRAKAELRMMNADVKKHPSSILHNSSFHHLFPDEFICSDEMGWIPKGWEVKPVDEALEINPRVQLKKGDVAKFVDMKSLPTSGFSVTDIITKPYSGGAKFKKGDVLLARITPCLENGKTGVVDFLNDDEVGFGSTEFIVLRGKGTIHTPFISCLARHENFRAHCI